MSHAAIHVPTYTGQTGSASTRVPTGQQHDQIVKQAQKWVAQTFYGALLKQVRNSPFHSQLFEGGRGGEAFGSMYDQRLAEHMARGTGSKLVNAIASRIEAKNAYRKSAEKGSQKQKDAKLLSTKWSGHVPTSLRA